MRRYSMDERAAPQAVELARALRDQLHEMTYHLAWLERQDVIGLNGRASAIGAEAAALRLDISEAQFFIDRLQRRYDLHLLPVGHHVADHRYYRW